MLEIKELTKYYGNTKGIENLSFKCNPYDILGILGHNGSGKTTLFRLLLGLIQKTDGDIYYPENIYRPTYFGYLPEERSLYKDISVHDQIMYLARLKKMKDQEIIKQMDYWLKRFELEHNRHTFIRELSKGNQQKVQFICALIHNPQVLILDEPLTGLDAYNVELFKQIMIEQSQMGKVILLSSHQYEEIEEFCNQIVLLKKGEIILSGDLKQLKQKDRRCCITINFDKNHSILNKSFILKTDFKGNYIRYTLSDRKYQNQFLSLLDYKEIDHIKIELIPLRDLVGERS